jgi:cyclopropane fatty-acyl-phospholipid synthase-like methyltransferase
MLPSKRQQPFWKVYTPRNIWLESVHRLKKLRPAPSEIDNHADKVAAFYDEYHDKFIRVYGNVIQAFRTRDVKHLLDYQIASMELRPGQRVLDAGCGVAAPAIHFARHAGVEVDGITISQKQYEAAVANVQAEGMAEQVRVVCGDYHRMPDYFPPASYDVVCFLESFGHSKAKQNLLDGCWTMLKPGGLLYIKDLFIRIPLLAEHKKKLPRKFKRSTKTINTTLPT